MSGQQKEGCHFLKARTNTDCAECQSGRCCRTSRSKLESAGVSHNQQKQALEEQAAPVNRPGLECDKGRATVGRSRVAHGQLSQRLPCSSEDKHIQKLLQSGCNISDSVTSQNLSCPFCEAFHAKRTSRSVVLCNVCAFAVLALFACLLAVSIFTLTQANTQTF